MITTRKAKILDRVFFTTVECPHCTGENMLDLSIDLGNEFATAYCEHCDEMFKINMFEYLVQHN